MNSRHINSAFKISMIMPALLLAPLLCLTTKSVTAGSATWDQNATTGDWNTAVNWTPDTIPNGRADIATFAFSSMTEVSFSAETQVDSIVFDSGASPFTIIAAPPAPTFTLSGEGIINNSGLTQNLVSNAGSKIVLEHNATLGFITVTSNGGSSAMSPGTLAFHDRSSAGSATLVANPSEIGGFGASILFKDNSTASHAIITANGDTGNGLPGNVHFRDGSSAAHATLVANPGTTFGGSIFLDGDEGSTAGDATIIANAGSNGAPGGNIYLWYSTSGGRARIELGGNGILDISNRSDSGVAIGSLEGEGKVYLGGYDLAVGRIKGLYSYFSGVIQDGGSEQGSRGSLTMSGPGHFTLQAANLYTGGTRVLGGVLEVANVSGSATGPNLVRVIGGTLTGFGAIDGMVIIGKGNGDGAFLAPGTGSALAETLTIRKLLKLEADGTYSFTLNSDNGATHTVNSNGAGIRGATILIADLGNSVLPAGTVLTALDNTSAAAISGTFSNLPDGSVVTIGSNTFQANYEGGDGNDLTLTVL